MTSAVLDVPVTSEPNVAAMRKLWKEDGFLVLPKFYPDSEIDAAHKVLEKVWTDPDSRVTVDDLNTGRRSRIGEVDALARATHRFKINDLYLEHDHIRRLALNKRISPILKALLGHRPVLCNSLNFAHGSAQDDHVDSLYMTPRSKGHLIAIWVALEDCHMDAGPLRYFPGSHKIDQYVFSTGSNHFVPDEMLQWTGYMQAQVAQHGLTAKTFAAKRGDVFIWSAYLLHGGSPINAPERTRKSIVFHYFSEEDSDALGLRLVPDVAGAYWQHRPHQAVPGSAAPEAPPLPFGQKLSARLGRLRRKLRA